MDTSSMQYQDMANQTVASVLHPPVAYEKQQRLCTGDAIPGEFPLSSKPSIVLHILTAYNVSPQDLAKLEATCSFFRQPANFHPDFGLSLAELASLDMCEKRMAFKTMTVEQKQDLKQRCGGSWKLVLRYLVSGEACSRREKSQAVVAPCHSVVLTSKGAVYTFGSNKWGQLGHETTNNVVHPQQIRSLQDVRIVHAIACGGRTILVSETGGVYAMGIDSFQEVNIFGVLGEELPSKYKMVTTPQLVESLKDIFVVQAVVGNYFTAVLSREGRVYTFSWGDSEKLGHGSEPDDHEPRPLLGALENIPVVQIAAGYCFLLALAFESGQMSVYSVGCGLGGKLGNGTTTSEKRPILIEHLKTLNLEPIAIAAGTWHAAVLGKDGRVCTWGWGKYGSLGHGNEDNQTVPMVVEALRNIKGVHISAGNSSTFVVSDDGSVYSFGCNLFSILGHDAEAAIEVPKILSPTLSASLEELGEKIVQIAVTNGTQWKCHTLALTESNKLYAFGCGHKGQLGFDLGDHLSTSNPTQVKINLK